MTTQGLATTPPAAGRAVSLVPKRKIDSSLKMLTVAELNRDLNKLKEERKKAWFDSIEEKVVGVEGVTRKWG